jgi:molybdopterin converting factor small subunit
MSVSVRIPTILRTYTGGQADVLAEGGTLSEVIESLEKNHPGIAARVLDDTGKLRRFVNVYVNDDDVRFAEGLQTPTPDGAGVSIIPAVAGGSGV